MRRYAWILVALAALAAWAWQRHAAPDAASASAIGTSARSGTAIARPEREPRGDVPVSPRDGQAQRWPGFLPSEALDTLALVEAGGPFPYRQDGATFQNREHRLPERRRGYYREYTVETPGASDRGARRIIAGGDPPSEFFYTDDHYDSFRRFTAADGAGSGGGGAR
jgi:guanyl-specific ribonuclease Sa